MTSLPLSLSGDPTKVADVLGNLDGSTTRFLAALLDQPLKARVILQARRPAVTALSRECCLRMGFAVDDIALVRRSQLIIDARDTVISANKVVLDVGHPLMADLDLGTDIPLGYLLGEIEQRREILKRGVRPWSWGCPDPFSTTRASAWRSYLIINSGQPLCHVEEVFHPDVISPPSAASGPKL
ncbi:chorismate pyruvate-lyase family protein [Nonomuraea sp. NPDC050478]|uniref:chorismate pyruvate-lyase family protein n=1 Tax=Nonomuraea sp. NPDC050478 TaxID=3364365 RepID=UPI003797BCA2